MFFPMGWPFLVSNKTFGEASIPSVNHSNTIANFIKGYYVKQNMKPASSHRDQGLIGDNFWFDAFAKHATLMHV